MPKIKGINLIGYRLFFIEIYGQDKFDEMVTALNHFPLIWILQTPQTGSLLDETASRMRPSRIGTVNLGVTVGTAGVEGTLDTR